MNAATYTAGAVPADQSHAPDIAKRLIANGYRPVPCREKRPIHTGWPGQDFTPGDFRAGQNVGIKTGQGIVLVDIDVTDPEASAAITAEWRRRHGGLQRTGLAPKTAFLVASDVDRKIDVKLTKLPKDSKGAPQKIEVLAGGQQFVAYGIHPDTGNPYQWHGLDPLDGFLGHASMLEAVTGAEVDDFLSWVRERYVEPEKKLSQKAQDAAGIPRFQIDTGRGGGFWRAVNDAALQALDLWVPALLPAAKRQATGAWRMTSRDLGRQFEEDLSIHPSGIQDYGPEAALTAIDLVMEHRGGDEKGAALWLCERIGADPAALGWNAAKAVEGAGESDDDFFRTGSELHGRPVPPREWLVPELIPMHTVTLLGGDGGTGKSLLALQLAVAAATGKRWLGLEVREGPTLTISAEDDDDELHRRKFDIVRAQGDTLATLTRYKYRSLAGEDALLARLDPGGRLDPTPLYERIDRFLAKLRPVLLVLDTSADLFPGNENDRAQVRQFIGMLKRLALRHRCAVVLLAHPSLTGLNTGSGLSGSTAWNNSVRSRLYFERITIKDGAQVIEDDPDRRVLRGKKANHARNGAELHMTWKDGVFVAEEAATGLDRRAADAKAERVFLRLLDEFAKEGRPVKSAQAQGYAPKAFVASGRAEGLSKQALHSAMERLFAKGEIVETLGGHRSPSKQTMRIVRASGAGC